MWKHVRAMHGDAAVEEHKDLRMKRGKRKKVCSPNAGASVGGSPNAGDHESSSLTEEDSEEIVVNCDVIYDDDEDDDSEDRLVIAE